MTGLVQSFSRENRMKHSAPGSICMFALKLAKPTGVRYAERTALSVADVVSVLSHYNWLGKHYSRLSSTICMGLVHPHGLHEVAKATDYGYVAVQRRYVC